VTVVRNLTVIEDLSTPLTLDPQALRIALFSGH
jgi:hypothetical protein